MKIHGIRAVSIKLATTGAALLSLLSMATLPVWAAAGTIKVYPISFNGCVSSCWRPSNIRTGPDGNLWFTDQATVFRMTLSNGSASFKEYNASGGETPIDIEPGPDGNMWFTDQQYPDSIDRVNISTGAVKKFPIPTVGGTPDGMVLGPDQFGHPNKALWFSEITANKIGRLEISSTGVVSIKEFPIPTPNSGTDDVGLGPNGDPWITEQSANKIGWINPATNHITEYKIPTADSGPFDLITGSDGNVWFTEQNVNRIGWMTPDGKSYKSVAVCNGCGAHLGLIDRGPDGNVWFTEEYVNKVGRVTPTFVLTQYNTATNAEPFGMTRGPATDTTHMWFTESGTGDIASVTTQ